MSKRKALGFINPDTEKVWAEAVDKVMRDASAKGSLLDADIPEYGVMGDLKKAQVEEIASRMARAATYAQARADMLNTELARRDAASMLG